MNVENINKVADAIEAACAPDARPEIGFNMINGVPLPMPGIIDLTGHNCKTACCIKGWTEYLFPESEAHLTLDLEDQRWYLFTPSGWSLGVHTPQHAVAVLRHLAKTGEVDWTVGAPSETEAA